MRACSEGQKRAVLDLIYLAWAANPEMCLGQLVCAAAIKGTDEDGAIEWLYSIDDFSLAEALK